MAIVTRQAKGSPLSFEELDNNFTELANRAGKVGTKEVLETGIAADTMLVFNGTNLVYVPRVFSGLLGTKTVDETNIGTDKVLVYNGTKLVYEPKSNGELVGSKLVDETNLGDKRILSYDSASEKLVYVDKPVESGLVGTKAVDETNLSNKKTLVYNNITDKLEYVSPTVGTSNVDETDIATGKYLKFDGTNLVYAFPTLGTKFVDEQLIATGNTLEYDGTNVVYADRKFTNMVIYSESAPLVTLDPYNINKLWVQSDPVTHRVVKVYTNLKGHWADFHIVSVKAGLNHSVLLSSTNEVYVTGDHNYGQLGLYENGSYGHWTRVPGVTAKAISCGDNSTMMINLADDHVYSTGENSHGQLGLGSGHTTGVTSFTDTGFIAKSIDCGGQHSMAINLADDHVYSTGDNSKGQLGLSNTTDVLSFTDTGAIAKSIACGDYNSMTINSVNDHVYSTGDNSHGQLGLGDTVDRNVFTDIGMTAKTISTGGSSSMLIDSSNKLYSTGNNTSGQLGLGNTTDVSSFTDTGMTARAVANMKNLDNGGTVIVNEADSHVYVTGSNSQGQLGMGNITTMSSFSDTTTMSSNTGSSILACGHMHTLLLGGSGKVYATGIDSSGQTTIDHTVGTFEAVFTDIVTNQRPLAEDKTFTGLSNTPSSMGNAGQIIKVASNGLDLEFVNDSENKTFTSLSDTPAAFTGYAGKILKVNSSANGIEFVNDSENKTFTSLSDTPSSIGTAGQIVKVNSAGDALEFVNDSENKTFTSLSDTPSSIGTAGQIVKVNSAGDALEFANDSGGSALSENIIISPEQPPESLDTQNTDKLWVYTDKNLVQRCYVNKGGYWVIPKILSVAQGTACSFLLLTTGDLYVTGSNDSGQFGLGNTNDITSWTRVPGVKAKALSCGAYFTAIINYDDNHVYSTGDNGHGQLGLGNTTAVSSFTDTGVKAKFIDCGYDHMLMINYDDDHVYSTGDNGHGQLGLGNTTDVSSFTDTGVTAKAVSCGNGSSMMINLADDNVYSTGSNGKGQLGLGGTDAVSSFTDTGVKAKAIALGGQNAYYSYSLLINLSDDNVYSTGDNSHGQLGLGDSDEVSENGPTNRVSFTNTGVAAKAIACSQYHSLLINLADDHVYSVGLSSHGDLGLGPYADMIYNFTDTGIAGAKLATDNYNRSSLVVSKTDKLLGCGSNASHALGYTGSDNNVFTVIHELFKKSVRNFTDLTDAPTTLGAAGQIIKVASNGVTLEFTDESKNTTFTSLSDTPANLGSAGQIVKMNSSANGLEFTELDFTSLTDTPNALGTAGQVLKMNESGNGLEFKDTKILFADSIPQVLYDQANIGRTYVQNDKGHVKALYENIEGYWYQLDVIAIAQYESSSMLITSNNDLYFTGTNWGQAGLGDTIRRTHWTKVPGIKAKAVTLGENISMIINLADDHVYSTGKNDYGQLGLGDTTNRNVFTDTGIVAKAVVCGLDHALIINSADDHVYSTGKNAYGQLGLGNTTDVSSFTDTGVTAKNIALGNYNSLMINSADDHVYSTGRNNSGQLGLGNTTDVSSFTDTGVTAKALAAGEYSSMMINLDDDHVYSTGRNLHGQLGLGNTSDVSSFTDTGVTAKALACGLAHALVINLADNHVYSTGKNDDGGQLGLGNTTNVSSFTDTGVIAKAVACGTESSLIIGDKNVIKGTGSATYGRLGLQQTVNVFTAYEATLQPDKDSGATASRPIRSEASNEPYMDTTLGKPIWYNGSAWVDATGTAV